MIKVNKFTLKHLQEKLESRSFAIPEIQRQFVWNKKKVCKLMDSIYKHYPIGICLIWNTSFSRVVQLRPKIEKAAGTKIFEKLEEIQENGLILIGIK